MILDLCCKLVSTHSWSRKKEAQFWDSSTFAWWLYLWTLKACLDLVIFGNFPMLATFLIFWIALTSHTCVSFLGDTITSIYCDDTDTGGIDQDCDDEETGDSIWRIRLILSRETQSGKSLWLPNRQSLAPNQNPWKVLICIQQESYERDIWQIFAKQILQNICQKGKAWRPTKTLEKFSFAFNKNFMEQIFGKYLLNR